MLAGIRSGVAGAVVSAVAAGVVVSPSVAPQSPGPPAITRAVALTAGGDSILNIPFNLFQAVVNIPATEVEAINDAAKSLLWTGNWFTPSATNIWGEDPGDPSHFMALIDLLIPFREISGLGSPEIDPVADAAGTAGLGQQLALVAAAEIPASASCDADWCSPRVPATPITGFTPIDKPIWLLTTNSGIQQFPLQDHWYKVPFSDLSNGYQFGTEVEPSMGVGPNGSVPSDSVFGYPGTIPLLDADGDQVLNGNGNPVNLMPWSDLEFKFNPLAPFQNFFNSLLAPPDINGFAFPGLTETLQALQALAAGVVLDFNPAVAGSPLCPGACELAPSNADLVGLIGNLMPGNPLIDHWLALNSEGLANAATQHQIDFAIQFLQGEQKIFDFGNPTPDNTPSTVDTPSSFPLDPVMQSLITFAQESGIQDFFHTLANLVGFQPADFDTADFMPPV